MFPGEFFAFLPSPGRGGFTNFALTQVTWSKVKSPTSQKLDENGVLTWHDHAKWQQCREQLHGTAGTVTEIGFNVIFVIGMKDHCPTTKP
jgi:hypothetical protein